MGEDRQFVITTFRRTGFQCAKDAISQFTEYIQRFESRSSKKEWLDKILEKLMNMPIKSNLIGEDVARSLINEYETIQGLRNIKILDVIDSFDVPKLLFDIETKKFREESGRRSIFGQAKDKGLIFIRRYQMVLQRILRNPMFTPALEGVQYPSGKYTLNTVDYLIGNDGRELEGDGGSKKGNRPPSEDIIVLGFLTEIRNNFRFIEDPTGMIRLNLTHTTFNTGIYNEGSLVLASGYSEDGIFHVNSIGLPPGETQDISNDYFQSVNFFGGLQPSHDITLQMEKIEAESGGSQIIFLSDVHLDSHEVMVKLKVLFGGFEPEPPLLFIFIGNFISELVSDNQERSPLLLKEYFVKLANLINTFPKLCKESKFLFVPGPTDPGFVNILPRPKYANPIIEETIRLLPNAIFTSNPCRIRYSTKKIVVVREEIINKMSNTSLHFPKENIPENFAKTLIGQGHLFPFFLDTCPVYWNYDHAFSLYPLPDVVIVADNNDAFTVELMGCTITNPGPFMKGRNFTFKTYQCSENTVEDCMIPHTEEED